MRGTTVVATAAAVAALACRPSRGGTASSPDISIRHAVIPAPPSPSEASGFLVLDNRGAAADTLLGVTSPEAGGIMLHGMVAGRMEMVPLLVLPPGASNRLVPGSYHLMLHELTRPLAAGDTVTLRFRFARAAPIEVRAPVLRYSEAVEESSSPRP
jgi:periplasmic copper chaperone A